MKARSKFILCLIIITLCTVMATFISACENKQDYDMSEVVFEDLTVEYDGQPHSILATNLPEGVTAAYDGNGQTEIGAYTVTAHFSGDSKKYKPIPDRTATLTITQPAKSRIMSATGFEIDETGARIYCDAPNGTGYIDLSDKITVTPNCTWKLYGDIDGAVEIPSKTVNLEIGQNTAYIIITDPNEKTVKYEVSIYRLDMKSYTFINDGEVYFSGKIQEKSKLEKPEDPEKIYNTFTGWAVEGSEGTVQFPYTVTEDTVFVAQYALKNYSITYYLNGGTNAEGNPAVYTPIAPDITLLPATRAGYTFDGWYSDDKFGAQVTVINQGSQGDIKLYAKWLYGSEGLIFELSGSEYALTGYNGDDSEIIVPQEWRGLPVTSIANGVFENCTKLEKITLPFVGKKAEGSQLGHIFGRDWPIVNNIPSSLKTVIITGGSVVYFQAFYDCKKIETISLPDNVTSIGNQAFYNCFNLKSVNIGNAVATIGESAFRYCYSLTSIEIPDSVTEIGDYAFGECNNLASVIFGKDSKLNVLNQSLFKKCTNLKSIEIPDSVTEIDSYVFEGCENLVSVTFGENSQLNKIGTFSFGSCKNLKSIAIPDGVTRINGSAFSSCNYLKSVTFGKDSKLTSIGSNAFNYCEKLTDIAIPDGVTSIGESAFQYCYSLVSVTFGEDSKLTSVGSNAFQSCTNLKSIAIPDSVTTIGESAFRYCSSLVSVTFGKDSKLTTIGERAFLGCSKLTSIIIPDGVTYIGRQAFLLAGLTGVIFKNTSGWVSDDLSLSQEDLKDPATAAEYLTKTYSEEYWSRS